jgi:hypothetical protein
VRTPREDMFHMCSKGSFDSESASRSAKLILRSG